MRITPLDVRKQEFNKSMRGFDCDEVRAFLNTMADEYEIVLIDNKQIREQLSEQGDKVAEYRNMERTLRDTLMTAERVMQDTRETATREGEVVIQEAHLKAKSILEECRLRTEELRREIIGLRKEKDTYLARFRGLAEAQITFIDTHESDFEDLDKRLVDIVDTVVTSTVLGSASAKAPVPVLASAPAPQVTIPQQPVTENFTLAAPQVAPTPTPAPVMPENDIWRDYEPNPAEGGTDNPSPAGVAVASSIADIVSESLAETSDQTDEATTDQRNEATTEADIPVEALTIDVISNGPAASGEASDRKGESVTETMNI